MKIKEILFALFIATLVLSSCKKEEEYNPENNYDITVISTSDVGEDWEIITPFEGENIELEVMKYSFNDLMYLGAESGCRISSHYRGENSESVDWLRGDYIEDLYFQIWCSGVYCHTDEPTYYPIKCNFNTGTRYGWIFVGKNSLKIVFPKDNSREITLGIME